MAIRQRLATTTTTALDFVFQASADTAVTSIHLCNVTSNDAVVNIYLLPSDGSTTVPTENNKIYNSLTIQGTDTYIIDTEKMILSSGDKIYVETPDSSSSVVATISTIGL
tara:strand:+ start:415 stop:744 length:330 start_codon:yes stop_codon:yes gene_type:complete